LNKKRRFSFGKYKGKTVEWVIKNDPQYINWLLTKSIKGFTLTPKERKIHNLEVYQEYYDGLSEEDILGFFPGDQ
jgi:hypothetical protein